MAALPDAGSGLAAVFGGKLRSGGGSHADAGLRRLYDGPAHHTHRAGAGDTRAECADSAAFAIAGLVIPGVTLTVLSRTCTLVPRFWPREFFLLFYAVHLAVIGLMVM
ncbi:TraX family protein [Salmonella enterica]